MRSVSLPSLAGLSLALVLPRAHAGDVDDKLVTPFDLDGHGNHDGNHETTTRSTEVVDPPDGINPMSTTPKVTTLPAA